MLRRIPLLALPALFACACNGEASYGDALDNPDIPPRGFEDIHAWLDAGYYLDWNCEVVGHPAEPGSGHGPNRICTNDALTGAATGSGSFPAGAAAVKEVLDSTGRIRVFAVYLKVAETAGGDSWYWYEGNRGNVIANGEGDGTCTGCHGLAPRDYVYTIVLP